MMATLLREKVELNPSPSQASFVDATEQKLILRDGRTLGYAEYGDPSGKPIFFFHGGAGSRLEHPADICAIGARIICIDRPGHGLSDFQPDRKLVDWPDDVAQLADNLGINSFYVLGWSAGGPHALVCAYLLPDRVMSGAVAAGLGPMNRPGAIRGLGFAGRTYVFAARYFPWLIGFFRRMARNTIWGNAEKAKQQLLSAIPNDDKESMLQSGNLDMWFADVREGYKQGWQGVALDDIIIIQDWGFDIADINCRIDIWHGEQDRNVPISSSEYMQERIPNSRATFLPGEEHLFLLSHWATVVQTLVTDLEGEEPEYCVRS
jgi:pimeloyl-ACP methyl ester carboxylesterase